MPKVEGAPKGLNDLLEEIYSKCIKSGKRKGVCAASAWSGVKDAGWYKGKDEKWHRKIKLNKEWTEKLLGLPESGMGYQKVDLCLKNDEKLDNLLVYNSETLELPEKYENTESKDIKEITLHSKKR